MQDQAAISTPKRVPWNKGKAHLVGDGQEMFEHPANLNFEDIVSKNADAPYRSNRNEAWLKIKAVQKGKFPFVGFVKDPTGVAPLYLGEREGCNLVYSK